MGCCPLDAEQNRLPDHAPTSVTPPAAESRLGTPIVKRIQDSVPSICRCIQVIA